MSDSGGDKFEVYFSHSWHAPDVPLNCHFWKLLSERCTLLVDPNDEENPPYYINRIEEIFNRQDRAFKKIGPLGSTHGDKKPLPWLTYFILYCRFLLQDIFLGP